MVVQCKYSLLCSSPQLYKAFLFLYLFHTCYYFGGVAFRHRRLISSALVNALLTTQQTNAVSDQLQKKVERLEAKEPHIPTSMFVFKKAPQCTFRCNPVQCPQWELFRMYKYRNFYNSLVLSIHFFCRLEAMTQWVSPVLSVSLLLNATFALAFWLEHNSLFLCVCVCYIRQLFMWWKSNHSHDWVKWNWWPLILRAHVTFSLSLSVSIWVYSLLSLLLLLYTLSHSLVLSLPVTPLRYHEYNIKRQKKHRNDFVSKLQIQMYLSSYLWLTLFLHINLIWLFIC